MVAAKDISDEVMLGAIRERRGAHGVPRWATLWDIQDHLAQYPKKVVVGKLNRLIKRNVIDGCACGCRGDFEIPGEIS